MSRRLLLILIALLIAAPASAQDFVLFKKKAAAATGCDMGKTTDGTSPTNQLYATPIATLYTASCSGTLTTAYALHNSAQSDTTKVCVYLDNNDSIANAGDTLIACVGIASSGTGVWATGTYSSGTIVSGNDYWIVLAPYSSDWAGKRETSGTSYVNNQEYYSMPADMSGGTWSSSTLNFSVYVHIQ